VAIGFSSPLTGARNTTLVIHCQLYTSNVRHYVLAERVKERVVDIGLSPSTGVRPLCAILIHTTMGLIHITMWLMVYIV
jgi:hypothetical protein